MGSGAVPSQSMADLHRYSNASGASPGTWVMPVGCLTAAYSWSSLLTILQLKSESNQTQLYEYTVARTLVSRPGLGTLRQDPSPLTFPLSSTCVAQGTTQIIPNHRFTLGQAPVLCCGVWFTLSGAVGTRPGCRKIGRAHV